MAKKLKIAKKTFALGSGLVVVGVIALVLGALYSQRENAYARLNKFLDNKIIGSSSGSSDSITPDTADTTVPNENNQQQNQQQNYPQGSAKTLLRQRRSTSQLSIPPRYQQQYYQRLNQNQEQYRPTQSIITPARILQRNNFRGSRGTATVSRNNIRTSSNIRREQTSRSFKGYVKTSPITAPTTTKRPIRPRRNVPTHFSTNSKATPQRKRAEARRASRYTRSYSNF